MKKRRKQRRSSRATTQFDRFVGDRMKEARIANDMSQEELGDALGVSYQQIQKYEYGTNRVPGARIELMVTLLRRPLNYFFPNATDVRISVDPMISQTLATKDGQELLRVFSRITSSPDRRLVVDFASRLIKEPAHG